MCFCDLCSSTLSLHVCSCKIHSVTATVVYVLLTSVRSTLPCIRLVSIGVNYTSKPRLLQNWLLSLTTLLYTLLVTACYRLFSYHCLSSLEGTSVILIVLFAGKSKHHLNLVQTRVSPRRVFTFTGHRSKYIRERVHAASVSVTHTHRQNQL